jgi:hypothetical protein
MAAAKLLALFALLAVSVSADAASKSYYPRSLTPPSTAAAAGISIPCVQYATLEQVLASGAISLSSAIALQGPLAVLGRQCLTDIWQQEGAATSLRGQQQAPSSVAQQQIIQQQLLPSLLQQQQALQQQQQQVLQQQQQAVLQPYLSNDILATANPAGFYGYGQQQQLPPYLFDAVNAINPAASYYGQEQQLFPSTPNAFSAVNPAASYEQQQLFTYLSNTPLLRQPFSAAR